jgi:uncharacterized protein YeeX (DUF496 family)
VIWKKNKLFSWFNIKIANKEPVSIYTDGFDPKASVEIFDDFLNHDKATLLINSEDQFLPKSQPLSTSKIFTEIISSKPKLDIIKNNYSNKVENSLIKNPELQSKLSNLNQRLKILKIPKIF